ncbi:MAG: hypothetical protein Q8N08_04720, partial [Methanobacteriaceae archaeon]|nr:hypothetical protein [Methanobacteriaceae archaeon]
MIGPEPLANTSFEPFAVISQFSLPAAPSVHNTAAQLPSVTEKLVIVTLPGAAAAAMDTVAIT